MSVLRREAHIYRTRFRAYRCDRYQQRRDYRNVRSIR